MRSLNWPNPKPAIGLLWRSLVTSRSECWPHYSHVRLEAKRRALDALAVGIKKVGYDTIDDTNPVETGILPLQATEKNGGDDGTRTRDLCRDRAAF